LKRHAEWVVLLYVVTCTVLANWVFPRSSATTPVFMIAIGLTLIFLRSWSTRPLSPARNLIGAIGGVVMVLTGVVWLIVLGL
jgi:hypothetical protein